MKFVKRLISGAGIAMVALLGMTGSNAQALPVNLLPNSDFASGLTGWSTQYVGPNAPGPTCCSGPFAITGTGQVTGDFDGNAGGGINFSEAITLDGGYADAGLSFTYKGSGSYSGLNRALSVVIRDATNTVDEATLFATTVPASDFGIAHTVSLTGLGATLDALAPGAYTFNFYEFIPQTYSGPGSMTLSSISFTATPAPEPASMALFGVGLAGLRLVRRKRA